MKLELSQPPDGRGKYALVRLRRLTELQYAANSEGTLRGPATERLARIDSALMTLEAAGMLDYGEVGAPDEFFVIKLHDKYARNALIVYADAARFDDPEYAADVMELADRAGYRNPRPKRLD